MRLQWPTLLVHVTCASQTEQEFEWVEQASTETLLAVRLAEARKLFFQHEAECRGAGASLVRPTWRGFWVYEVGCGAGLQNTRAHFMANHAAVKTARVRGTSCDRIETFFAVVQTNGRPQQFQNHNPNWFPLFVVQSNFQAT